jgi:hypothetical protein
MGSRLKISLLPASRRRPAPTLDVFWDNPHNAKIATRVAQPYTSRNDLAVLAECVDCVQEAATRPASASTFGSPDFC